MNTKYISTEKTNLSNSMFTLWSSVSSVTNGMKFDINMILNMIKHNSHYQQIETARKHSKGTDEYNNIKRSLPAVTWNFEINGRRNDKSAVKSTGVIYVDQDFKTKEEAITAKERFASNKYVIATWLSLSELGVGALVRVDNINIMNFTDAYCNICLDLDIEYDKGAAKISQPNILSYDPNIYINLDAEVYIYPPEIRAIERINELSPDDFVNKDVETPIDFKNNTLKFVTELDEYSDDIVYVPEGKKYIAAFWPFTGIGTPKKVIEGNRNKHMSVFVNNLVILNPNATYNNILPIVNSINQAHCIPSLSQNDINKIINSKINNRKNLVPYGVKTKKYWVRPNYSGNKRKLFMHKQNEIRKDSTITKIETWIGEELYNRTEKVTQQVVSNETGLSIATIKRYWNQYKDIIKEFNQTLKSK